MADPVDGFDPANVDRSKRLEPGSNASSLCQPALDWLVESNFEGPVALTAQVAKQSGNAGDILFQRIAKVLDQMLEGTHGQAEEPPAEVAEEAPASEEKPVTTS